MSSHNRAVVTAMETHNPCYDSACQWERAILPTRSHDNTHNTHNVKDRDCGRAPASTEAH